MQSVLLAKLIEFHASVEALGPVDVGYLFFIRLFELGFPIREDFVLKRGPPIFGDEVRDLTSRLRPLRGLLRLLSPDYAVSHLLTVLPLLLGLSQLTAVALPEVEVLLLDTLDRVDPLLQVAHPRYRLLLGGPLLLVEGAHHVVRAGGHVLEGRGPVEHRVLRVAAVQPGLPLGGLLGYGFLKGLPEGKDLLVLLLHLAGELIHLLDQLGYVAYLVLDVSVGLELALQRLEVQLHLLLVSNVLADLLLVLLELLLQLAVLSIGGGWVEGDDFLGQTVVYQVVDAPDRQVQVMLGRLYGAKDGTLVLGVLHCALHALH